MKPETSSHVERLLKDGLGLLGEERGREAALVFSRVLLESPSLEEARRGLERAQSLAAEQERLARARVAEAESALARGDAESARRLIEDALARGADRDLALPLLDRLDPRAGRVSDVRSVASAGGASALPGPARGPLWPRVAVVALWSLAFALLAASLATSFEGIVDGLTRTPRPHSLPALPKALPAPASATSALVEARRYLAEGDVLGAMQALDRVPLQDPAYPLARQLRAEADHARSAGEGSR